MWPSTAQARNCCAQAQAPPCAAYWNAAAVFVGRVETIKRSGTVRVVSFAVLHGIRGVGSSSIAVSTVPAGQHCSIAFRVGREYVVYADRADEGLVTSACSRTRPVEDAASDLDYARAVAQGAAPAGQIRGRVLFAPRDLSGRAMGVPQPLADIGVTITGDDRTDSTRTDRAGDFRIDSRGPGTYRIRVDVPERYYADDSTSTITLRDARSCAEIVSTVHDDGQLRGRVLDAAGAPVAGLTLELTAAKTANGSLSPSFEANRGVGGNPRRTVTDREGRYLLARIPPGRFQLSVPAGPSAADGRDGRIVFSGLDGQTTANRIALAAGARVSLGDFRIPAQHRFVRVSGVVLDAVGTPAEGARIYLKGDGDDDRIVSEAVEADFMGRFVIAARAGTKYRVFGERLRAGARSSRVDSTDPIPVIADDNLKPLRLTLRRRY